MVPLHSIRKVTKTDGFTDIMLFYSDSIPNYVIPMLLLLIENQELLQLNTTDIEPSALEGLRREYSGPDLFQVPQRDNTRQRIRAHHQDAHTSQGQSQVPGKIQSRWSVHHVCLLNMFSFKTYCLKGRNPEQLSRVTSFVSKMSKSRENNAINYINTF